MLTVLVPALVSFTLTLLVVRHARDPDAFWADHDLNGPQKFHGRPVPRIGGVGIYAGLWACVAAAWFLRPWDGWFPILLMTSAIPAFVAGVAEDITKKISPGQRLLATGISALLAVWLLGAVLTRTDIPGLDWLVSFPVAAALLTVFVVAGVANAVNIIDGFNGLASMCACLILLAIAFVAYQVGDRQIAFWACAGVAAIVGFFVWNFPAGLIFLGDGGAYFLGFYIAELALLLISRHPSVSPLFALMVCIYPVYETVFSIYRRRFLRAVPPGLPDGIHLHSLIYRRLLRWAIGRGDAKALTRRNSATAPYLWALSLTSLIPALLWWDSTPMLAACIVGFGVLYTALYWRIVRFRTPVWLHLPRRR